MADCLLHLICSPKVEDSLAEWLLERAEVPGFTSLPIAGHGSSEQSMSLAEQVAGRSRRVMFLLELPEPTARALLEAVRADFSGSGLHYWLLPMLAAGHID
ncbi:DUF3240 family protein [Halochromatium salexigens]|jgi:hypothetical protein|uniref:DUF3240 domain-containing protein n=1 Tax=Halochromatium salexigens TaxID=49447 RepID=A0AAJ0UGF7_HALSE|nr:DUF3240 family protein [Halochromatium salexigens]MBK5931014.1 hypothetical protein [Halochromatium salexigens]